MALFINILKYREEQANQKQRSLQKFLDWSGRSRFLSVKVKRPRQDIYWNHETTSTTILVPQVQ